MRIIPLLELRKGATPAPVPAHRNLAAQGARLHAHGSDPSGDGNPLRALGTKPAVGGLPSAAKNPLAGRFDGTPQERTQDWRKAGVAWIHITDVEAALGHHNQWERLTRLVGNGLQVQFGGGVRHMAQVQQLLDIGVKRVVVGTQAVRNPQWTRELCRIFPGKIVLCLEGRQGELAVDGRRDSHPQDAVAAARSLDDAGLAAILFGDLGQEGLFGDEQRERVRQLRRNAPRTPLVVSGALSLEDLRFLKAEGVAAALVEVAAMEPSFDLASAVKEFDSPSASYPAMAAQRPAIGIVRAMPADEFGIMAEQEYEAEPDED